MEKSACCFCKKTTHVTDYCRDFDNLRSRYSEILKRGQEKCLCPEYVPKSKETTICKCGTICTVCFQHHHVFLCPKRDPEHPSNPILMPEPFSFLSVPSLFTKRFFELCNPCDQSKLQKCNKYFIKLQSIPLKFEPDYSRGKILSPNLVLNNFGPFIKQYPRPLQIQIHFFPSGQSESFLQSIQSGLCGRKRTRPGGGVVHGLSLS
uniref:Uncharacterized protein n=1 Tax=Panagrolaimus sp. PS1159 TaxID=55785 RepID=A0AC35GQE6_9BILA